MKNVLKSHMRIYILTIGIFVVLAVFALMSSLSKEEFVFVENMPIEYVNLDNDVDAAAVAIYDLDTGQMLAGKNPYTPLSIASITKLMSALIAGSYLHTNDIATINEEDFELTPNTEIRIDEEWRAMELLEYSLITSSNRGINSIGRTIEEKTGFSMVDLMNEFARDNALVNTHFVNPTGLDIHSELSGSESSAFDIARTAQIILTTQPKWAQSTTKEKETFYSFGGRSYIAINTNVLLGSIEDTVLLSKTGYTDIAGGALIMVLRMENGSTIGFVVLGSTRNGRFENMKTLINIYKTRLQQINILQ